MVFVYNLNMFMEVKNLQSTPEIAFEAIRLVRKTVLFLIDRILFKIHLTLT